MNDLNISKLESGSLLHIDSLNITKMKCYCLVDIEISVFHNDMDTLFTMHNVTLPFSTIAFVTKTLFIVIEIRKS